MRNYLTHEDLFRQLSIFILIFIPQLHKSRKFFSIVHFVLIQNEPKNQGISKRFDVD